MINPQVTVIVNIRWICNSCLIVKNCVFYTTKLVNSYFHLLECGYHYDRVDVDALAAGTSHVDEDPVALYLGYYN
jgi:hypothetical protein